VADHHTYFVTGKAWRFAVWTHNEYSPTFFANQAFHFMIRDNTTDTMLFMGRVDDPTQAENDLEPSFVATAAPALPGDYNLDRSVDAADYALWRNSVGNSVTAFSSADGNGNGKIDQPDYQVWRANFGRTLPAVAPPIAASASVDPATAPDQASSLAEEVQRHSLKMKRREAAPSPLASDALFALFGLQPRPRQVAATSPRSFAMPTHTSGNANLLVAVDRVFGDRNNTPPNDEALDAVLIEETDVIVRSRALAVILANL
jgi:hypothetical protein